MFLPKHTLDKIEAARAVLEELRLYYTGEPSLPRHPSSQVQAPKTGNGYPEEENTFLSSPAGRRRET